MINIDEMKPIIVEKLKHLNPKKIILFGSYAYGNPTQYSDLDILVIEDSIKNKLQEKRRIREALKSLKAPKDILLVDNNYYLTHSDKNWINTALHDARYYGEVLYEQK